MNKIYETPSFEIIEVELEEVLCQSDLTTYGIEDLCGTTGLNNYNW